MESERTCFMLIMVFSSTSSAGLLCHSCWLEYNRRRSSSSVPALSLDARLRIASSVWRKLSLVRCVVRNVIPNLRAGLGVSSVAVNHSESLAAVVAVLLHDHTSPPQRHHSILFNPP